MGHTPGPWGCDGTEVHAEHLVICNAYRSRTDDEGNWMRSEEVEANARLIAAAPDLLAACQAIANDCERVLDGDDFSGMPDAELFRAFLDVLRPAIAKAEGTDGQDRSLD